MTRIILLIIAICSTVYGQSTYEAKIRKLWSDTVVSYTPSNPITLKDTVNVIGLLKVNGTSVTTTLADTAIALRTAINAIKDSNVVYRTAINKDADSIASHRSAINATIDSIVAHRLLINTITNSDSVDIPIICGFTGQTWSGQTIVTAGFDGTFAVQNDSLSSKNSFGISGRVIAMYINGKLNTLTAPATMTLQYADSSQKVFSSALTTTISPNQTFASTTNQTLIVTPYKIGGFKFVSSSGSGNFTLGTITLVIRTKLN